MSNATLKKFVLAPIVISAAVFGTLTLPLAILGKQPIEIQFQKEPLFQGQLRDVATPYLGLATVLSLGTGFASIAFSGWRRSNYKSSEVEAQLSDLARNLKEKEAQLEALKLSESRLVTSGLSAFVDENLPLEPVVKTPTVNPSRAEVVTNSPLEAKTAATSTFKVVNTPIQHRESEFMTAQEAAQAKLYYANYNQNFGSTPAAARFASAQGFLGHTQAKAAVNPPTSASPLVPQDVELLYSQMQEIMAQMESVQAALSQTRTNQKPDNGASPQVTQSWSVQERVS